MSVSAVLAYRWDGKRSQLFFQTKEDSYNAPSLMGFLDGLKREYRGKKCILIWDGLPAHRSNEMTAYIMKNRKWLTIEALPGYSPDLNPVETLWGNIKGQELANRCAKNLGEMEGALRHGMRRVRRRTSLPFSFLHHAGLFF